jgi:hypothetical protein
LPLFFCNRNRSELWLKALFGDTMDGTKWGHHESCDTNGTGYGICE